MNNEKETAKKPSDGTKLITSANAQTTKNGHGNSEPSQRSDAAPENKTLSESFDPKLLEGSYSICKACGEGKWYDPNINGGVFTEWEEHHAQHGVLGFQPATEFLGTMIGEGFVDVDRPDLKPIPLKFPGVASDDRTGKLPVGRDVAANAQRYLRWQYQADPKQAVIQPPNASPDHRPLLPRVQLPGVETARFMKYFDAWHKMFDSGVPRTHIRITENCEDVRGMRVLWNTEEKHYTIDLGQEISSLPDRQVRVLAAMACIEVAQKQRFKEDFCEAAAWTAMELAETLTGIHAPPA
jgi:hypothetical protein